MSCNDHARDSFVEHRAKEQGAAPQAMQGIRRATNVAYQQGYAAVTNHMADQGMLDAQELQSIAKKPGLRPDVQNAAGDLFMRQRLSDMKRQTAGGKPAAESRLPTGNGPAHCPKCGEFMGSSHVCKRTADDGTQRNRRTSTKMQDYRLQRQSAAELTLPNKWDIPLRIWANEEVPIQRVAVDELLALLDLQETAQAVAQHYGFGDVGIEQVSISPDFHKGAGIPIGTSIKTHGFSVPAAIGGDINCGMRLCTTNLSADDLTPARLDTLERALRLQFFGGERNIALTPEQRHSMLEHGILGLLDSGAIPDTSTDQVWQELERMHGNGGMSTTVPDALSDYVRGSGQSSHDGHIGSVGGGNHFVEIQRVEEVLDAGTSFSWGLKPGQIVVMIHSGSLGFGQLASSIAKEACRRLYPDLPKPANGIYPLFREGPYEDAFRLFEHAMRAAANFAYANRFYMEGMVRSALEQVGMPCKTQLVYDAPHNLMWQQGDSFLHRKGSTPAQSWQDMQNTPFAATGEPVIVPGSMGASSYLLKGQSNAAALHSAAHGAGRSQTRGQAMKADTEALDAFLRDFRIVTPTDPRQLRGRADLTKAWRADVMQEAPWAYKDITPVMESIQAAEIASPVARMLPVMTLKG